MLGVTDGKAVGTYVEHLFQTTLQESYPDVELGNSAKGIDLPDPRLNTDIKVTSIRQPQSSCPYKDASQKIFGLGYNILLFVYDKQDTADTCRLAFVNCSLIRNARTADYTVTYRLREMLNDGANTEDIAAYLNDRNIPGDEIALCTLAERVKENPPDQGYLTISNALQWRLQYGRIIALHNTVDGIENYDA